MSERRDGQTKARSKGINSTTQVGKEGRQFAAAEFEKIVGKLPEMEIRVKIRVVEGLEKTIEPYPKAPRYVGPHWTRIETIVSMEGPGSITSAVMTETLRLNRHGENEPNPNNTITLKEEKEEQPKTLLTIVLCLRQKELQRLSCTKKVCLSQWCRYSSFLVLCQ